MSKQSAIILANCQGTSIRKYLNLHRGFRRSFHAFNYPAFKPLEVPQEQIRTAGLVIRQAAADPRIESNIENWLAAHLPRVETIKIPTLSLAAFWPNLVRHGEDDAGTGVPFGRFPHGDRFIMRAIDAGSTIEDAVNAYMAVDLAAQFPLFRLLLIGLETTKRLELTTTIRISDYLVDHLFTHQTFYSPMHPREHVLYEMARRILKLMGLKLRPHRLHDRDPKGPPEQAELPIHPSVGEAFRLGFLTPERAYRMRWGGTMSARQWYMAYAKHRLSLAQRLVRAA